MFPHLERRTTSHFMHFILTVLTGGLWILPWVACYVLNANHNSRVSQNMAQLMNQNKGPQTIIIEHRNI